LILIFGVPNSPRWLVLYKNNLSKAKELLKQLQPQSDPEVLVQEIQRSAETGHKEETVWAPRYRKLVWLAFLLAFFNQLSGINFVIYYAPRILEQTGAGANTALLATAGIGVVNVVMTLIGMYLIDRAGRRVLMLIGSIGYIISLALVARAFFLDQFEGVPILLFLFIASHAVGQGAVIWVFLSEIFPNKIRAQGQGIGTSTHWIFAGAITLLMPYVLNTFSGGPIFAFFSGMMILQLLFVVFIMPETKGVPLEELQKKLIN